MYLNSIYFGPNVQNLREYFRAKVYTIWVYEPLGMVSTRKTKQQ